VPTAELEDRWMVDHDVRAALDRVDPDLGIFIELDPDAVLREAANSRAAGRLAGEPVAIKDLIDTAHMRTTYGSKIFSQHVPDRDARIVERLRAEDAVIFGKTNLDEFAFGVAGYNSHFGPVLNPRDTQRTSGGSSSGSAAAVAAGICRLAVGTDTRVQCASLPHAAVFTASDCRAATPRWTVCTRWPNRMTAWGSSGSMSSIFNGYWGCATCPKHRRFASGTSAPIWKSRRYRWRRTGRRFAMRRGRPMASVLARSRRPSDVISSVSSAGKSATYPVPGWSWPHGGNDFWPRSATMTSLSAPSSTVTRPSYRQSNTTTTTPNRGSATASSATRRSTTIWAGPP